LSPTTPKNPHTRSCSSPADPTPPVRPRLDAVTGLGQRLGIGALIVDRPGGAAVEIATTTEGTVDDARAIDLPPSASVSSAADRLEPAPSH
jgi:hypothetical protein